MWHDSILGTIGNTPLVRLNRVAKDLPCTILVKLEMFNPGGSVKDRIGLAMIEDAEQKGHLKPGGTIIEGTSGNTGAGLALVAIERGYKCIFTTTDKQSPEKVDVLRGLGAEVIVCPTNVAPEDPRSYYSVAKRLSEEIPNSFYPNQYDHPANAEAHYHTTGPELWDQTEGRITHFIAGAGTGGTISGTARFLKEKRADVKIIGVDPFGSVYYKYFHDRVFDEAEIYPYATEGVGEDILAGNMNFDIIDDYVRVSDKDSMVMTRRLAREEGLFLGQSSGMAVVGALQWLRDHSDDLRETDVVVILVPDTGFRYLSKTYNDEWMRRNGFLERRPEMTATQVLSATKRGSLISVTAEATLADAIGIMAQHGISQVPVLEGDLLVGSLDENRILARLVEEAGARDESVRSVMGSPLPVVPEDLHLDQLSEYLESPAGAVLVGSSEAVQDLAIITRSDLISALAELGRRSNGA
ncbi:cystathionine beta-synthase [soil metagenome]